jgi:hypothetical protein
MITLLTTPFPTELSFVFFKFEKLTELIEPKVEWGRQKNGTYMVENQKMLEW